MILIKTSKGVTLLKLGFSVKSQNNPSFLKGDILEDKRQGFDIIKGYMHHNHIISHILGYTKYKRPGELCWHILPGKII